MKLNPFFNAFMAFGYIAGVILMMNKMQSVHIPENMNTIIIPVLILSLLVLSVTVMAFLFGYQPFRLYFENSKKEALVFFGKTVLSFVCIALVFLLIFLYVTSVLFN